MTVSSVWSGVLPVFQNLNYKLQRKTMTVSTVWSGMLPAFQNLKYYISYREECRMCCPSTKRKSLKVTQNVFLAIIGGFPPRNSGGIP